MIPLADTVTILTAPVVTDRYGNQTYDWTEATSTEVAALVQVTTGTEIHGVRERQTHDALLFLAGDAVLTGRDRVLWNGSTWAVQGPPARPGRPGSPPHHLEARLALIEEGPR